MWRGLGWGTTTYLFSAGPGWASWVVSSAWLSVLMVAFLGQSYQPQGRGSPQTFVSMISRHLRGIQRLASFLWCRCPGELNMLLFSTHWLWGVTRRWECVCECVGVPTCTRVLCTGRSRGCEGSSTKALCLSRLILQREKHFHYLKRGLRQLTDAYEVNASPKSSLFQIISLNLSFLFFCWDVKGMYELDLLQTHSLSPRLWWDLGAQPPGPTELGCLLRKGQNWSSSSLSLLRAPGAPSSGQGDFLPPTSWLRGFMCVLLGALWSLAQRQSRYPHLFILTPLQICKQI